MQFARPEVKGGFPLTANTAVWLRATVTNHGAETAHITRFTFFVDVVGQPATPDVEEAVWKSTVGRSPLELVKGEDDIGTGDFRFVDAEAKLDAQALAGLRSGQYSLFATGIARYRDHLGELTSELCVHLIPGSDQGQPLWRRCVNHNRVGIKVQ